MLTPIPYPLSLYVSPAPQSSLTLVTSVLDATSNWLILRYILAALNGQEPPDKNTPVAGSLGYENQENCKVVFVSILRGFEQWREMGKKMVRKLLFLGGFIEYWKFVLPYCVTLVLSQSRSIGRA